MSFTEARNNTEVQVTYNAAVELNGKCFC